MSKKKKKRETDRKKEDSQELNPGYENSMIPQAVCLGLTNLVATCLKTQKLGHITQYLFSDFFFSECLRALMNSKGIQRNQGKQSSGKGVSSD